MIPNCLRPTEANTIDHTNQFSQMLHSIQEGFNSYWVNVHLKIEKPPINQESMHWVRRYLHQVSLNGAAGPSREERQIIINIAEALQIEGQLSPNEEEKLQQILQEPNQAQSQDYHFLLRRFREEVITYVALVRLREGFSRKLYQDRHCQLAIQRLSLNVTVRPQHCGQFLQLSIDLINQYMRTKKVFSRRKTTLRKMSEDACSFATLYLPNDRYASAGSLSQISEKSHENESAL